MRISDLAESIGIRPKPYRILTLDGGGVRGIIPVLWLERLEKYLGGPEGPHRNRPDRNRQTRGREASRRGGVRAAYRLRPWLPGVFRPGGPAARDPAGRRNEKARAARHRSGEGVLTRLQTSGAVTSHLRSAYPRCRLKSAYPGARRAACAHRGNRGGVAVTTIKPGGSSSNCARGSSSLCLTFCQRTGSSMSFDRSPFFMRRLLDLLGDFHGLSARQQRLTILR